jgi:hypothetical protein
MPTFKINYSGGKFRVVNVNKLPNKTTLQSLDRVYLGQPFVNVVSKFQDTRGLDTVYLSQPFYGHTDGYSVSSIRSGIDYHPDVDAWLDRVIANGGNASPSTIDALTNFCTSIDNAGLRNKFYRLNLFCGNNLASCLIPIYFGTQYNSFPYGFANGDRNFNFLDADYTEAGASGGLLGNGSTKYLDTGVIINQIGITGHVSCYHKGAMSSSTSNVLIRGADGINGIGIDLNSGTNLIRGFYSPANIAAFSTNIGGHYLVTRRSPIDMVLYTNGTTTRVDSIVTNNVNFVISSWTLYVFALNNVGIPTSLCPSRIQSYSVGSSMTQSEANTFYGIMQTFQTALGRNQ